MNEFLFVIPEDWDQIDLTGQTALTYEQAATMCAESNWYSMTDALHNMNLILPEQTVIAARVFNGEIMVVQLV